MKFTDVETRYLAFNYSSNKFEEELSGAYMLKFMALEEKTDKVFSIVWRFKFKNYFGEEIYSEITETRFNYFSLGDSEKDFKDLKTLVVHLVLDARKRLLSKNENIQFPEFNVEELTCQILEKILFNETK